MPTRRVAGTRDPLSVSLHDSDLQAEVDLTTQFIIAANEVDRPLTEREIDAILGIVR